MFHIERGSGLRDIGTPTDNRMTPPECYYFCPGAAESLCPDFTGYNQSQALADAVVLGAMEERMLPEDDFSFQTVPPPQK